MMSYACSGCGKSIGGKETVYCTYVLRERGGTGVYGTTKMFWCERCAPKGAGIERSCVESLEQLFG